MEVKPITVSSDQIKHKNVLISLFVNLSTSLFVTSTCINEGLINSIYNIHVSVIPLWGLHYQFKFKVTQYILISWLYFLIVFSLLFHYNKYVSFNHLFIHSFRHSFLNEYVTFFKYIFCFIHPFFPSFIFYQES